MTYEQMPLALMPAEILREKINKMGLYAVWHGASDWYNFDSRTKKYHNLHHALDVVKAVYELTEMPSLALLFAAKWHDAVYVPKAGGDSNERCSSAALNVCYQKQREFESQENMMVIEGAQDLIVNTDVATHLSTERIPQSDLAILLDADLSSLAADWPVFIQNQKDIISENFGTWPKDQLASAAFLKQFLTVRTSIYHTDKARELWEADARQNILKYLDAVEL
jgi:predicted metal-dependent HD superfamily phosphohydrolase